MKNINKIALFALLPAMTLLFSCDDKDKATGDSNLVATKDVKGTVNIPFTGVQSSNENDETEYSFTITLDKPQVAPVVVAVHQISGNATDGKDFDAPHSITIPAYATSATGTVKILKDDLVEGVETFTLQVGDITTSNAGIPTKTMSFSIDNYLSPNLDLVFDFQHEFSISGTKYDLCGIGYDMDYYILDASYNDTGVYGAATVACPEKITITPTTLPDGVYHIFANIYDDRGLVNVYHDPFKIPTTVEYFRAGGIAKSTFAQETAFIPTSIEGPSSNLHYVITVEKMAGVFTLKNSVPEVIASGRIASKLDAIVAAAKPHLRK
ncbi:MAG: Calx-beta domain-containing protein [Limnohabitans sp.]|nr:Calx-beta domain-containing protein [Limnohabitans sp.]